MTKPTGKPKGRPKKVEPVNPDELPATQGYVKCIARKIHQHTHNQNAGIGVTWGTALFAWAIIGFTGLVQSSRTYNTGGFVPLIPNEIWYAIVAVAIVTTVVGIDLYNTDQDTTNEPRYVESIDKSIEKWKPEKCEEKEC